MSAIIPPVYIVDGGQQNGRFIAHKIFGGDNAESDAREYAKNNCAKARILKVTECEVVGI
jgi:hypothetical protein